MRKYIYALCLLVASSVGAATLPLTSEMLTYEGFFRLPTIAAYNGGTRDTAYAADCMGETDPSPSDGYPGCLIHLDDAVIVDNGKGQVIMSDIVPPDATGTNTASTVLSTWDLNSNLPYLNGYLGGYGSDEMAIYYDDDWDGLGNCRIVWIYYHEYATQPFDDAKIFGYSDCDATTPNPQGMWRWTSQADADTSLADPFKAHKWVYNITKIPSDIATDYFGGDQMLLGPGKSSGSRGSSAGPSVGVRPWTFPTDADGWDEFVPLVYYNSASGYTEWYVDSAFRGYRDVQWNKDDWVLGSEVIRITYAGDDYEALLTFGRQSFVDASVYPLSDPNAAPDDPGYGITTETYQNPGSFDWPDPDVVPVHFYGIEFFDGDYDQQSPSFTDSQGDGTRMPTDTNIVSYCAHGTGPTSQFVKNLFWFYDLAELGDMYAGTSIYGPDELQPYDEYVWQFDPDNDGYDVWDNCSMPKRDTGLSYDRANNLIYVGVFPNPSKTGSPPYSGGVNRGIAVWSIDVTGGSGLTQGNKNKAEGGSASGGDIQ